LKCIEISCAVEQPTAANETLKSTELSPTAESSKDSLPPTAESSKDNLLPPTAECSKDSTTVLSLEPESNTETLLKSSAQEFSPTQLIQDAQSTPIPPTVTSSLISSPLLSGSTNVLDSELSIILPPSGTASPYSSEEEDIEEERDGSLLGFGRDLGSASPSDISSFSTTISPDGSSIPRSSGSKSRRKSDRVRKNGA